MIYLNKVEDLQGVNLEHKSVLYYNGEKATVQLKGDSDGGLIYEQDAPKTYTKEKLASIYENFCIIGALLSKDGDNWTIWNTNPEETNYWDCRTQNSKRPSTQYGEVIAVCVGRGLWAKLGWSGLSATYKWAINTEEDIYKNYHKINIHGNGWESTTHIFTKHGDILTGTIWEQLKNGATDDYDLYLPSCLELYEIFHSICNNAHSDESTGTKTDHYYGAFQSLFDFASSSPFYWTSSQSIGGYNYNYAISIRQDTQVVAATASKTTSYRSIALLHF